MDVDRPTNYPTSCRLQHLLRVTSTFFLCFSFPHFYLFLLLLFFLFSFLLSFLLNAEHNRTPFRDDQPHCLVPFPLSLFISSFFLSLPTEDTALTVNVRPLPFSLYSNITCNPNNQLILGLFQVSFVYFFFFFYSPV